MEIDVANTKIENGYMHKYLPLTFFVANVEWLMRNYKDRQFIIFGDLDGELIKILNLNIMKMEFVSIKS